MNWSLGIDLGGTRIKALGVGQSGEVIARGLVDTKDDDSGDWVGRVRDAATSIEQEVGSRPLHVGMCAPGLAAPDGRTIEWMEGRLEAIQGLNWTEALDFGLPVRIMNDAHAALLGEARAGAAAGCRNAVMLTLGTGVGGAAMCDGVMLRGAMGRAGHLGHICLDPDGELDITRTPGSLEDAIGECTLTRRCGGRYEDTRALVAAHVAGDTSASEVWLRSVYYLACGLVSIINTLDPEIVVLGGGIAKAGAALWDPLEEHMARIEWRPGGRRVKIVKAQLGEWAGARGAAFGGMDSGNES